MNYSNSALLELWEQLRSATPQRSNALLAAESLALPVARIHDETPLGIVQAAILRLYSRAFGAVLQCSDACPECGTRIAADLSTANLIASQESAPSMMGEMSHDGWDINYRAPANAICRRPEKKPIATPR